MPINPNIALGIQPVQQPNILGQMGQIMAIRQAQQEMEGSEDVRNYFAKPTTDRGDPSQLLGTKQGQAAFKALNESQFKQLEIDQKRVNLVGASAGAVLNNPTMETFTTVVSDLVKRGIYTPEQRDQAFAAVGNDPSKIKAFVTPIYEQAISAEKRLSDITSRRNQDVSSGASYGQLALAREKDAREVAQQEELAKMMRQTNALATAAAPTSDPYERINNLDTRIEQLMSTGNPKAIPIAQALNAQRTQLLASAKNQYGGQLTTMEVTDPDTGQRTVVQARPDQYGRLVPVELGAAPLSTNASATGGTTISPTVARPAPTAAVVKERQAVEKLPEAIAMNTDAIRKIDEMIGGVDAKGNPLPGAKGKPHPGFNGAVGFGLGAQYIPGTDARGFKARHEEVLSQAFLDAFEALKGGGAITEKEGEKATSARTRMNLATSEKEYMDAAREYQGVLKRGIENARSRMQRSGSTPPASPSAPSSIDALLDKYK